MKNSFEFKKNHENLYNKIIKELKRYYKTNHIQEPQRKEGYLYPEEMKYVERLDLSSTGSLFIRLNNKPLISYLTGLEELTIRPPLQSTEEILKELPNKNKLRILIIDKTDYETLNLNPFTNLQSLTITNNYYLKEIKGLDKLNRLTKIEFYNNTHYDENEICDYLIKCIDKKCHIRTDILYYKTIVSLIKTEYSKYREYFRKIKWIETYNISNNRIQEISHDTVSTGKFFSSLEDILDEILPISEIDDIESIYLIYSWLIINFSYKTTNIKESIVNKNNYKKLNFNQKEQKTKKIYNMIGGSNGAFNALYGKAIINEKALKKEDNVEDEKEQIMTNIVRIRESVFAENIFDDKDNHILKASLKYNPFYPEGWLDLAQFEYTSDNISGAEKYVNTAAFLTKNNPRYFYYKSLVNSSKNDIQTAHPLLPIQL